MYRTVYELSAPELSILKERYLIETRGNVSYGELCMVDELVPDEVVYEYYDDVMFTQDDFGIEGCKGIGTVDQDAVREILLWFENTEDIYHRFEQPLRNSLVKKMRKGIELSEDYLAASSVIDTIVRETLRSYFRSFGSFPVSTETRREMKREIAHSIMLGAQDDYEYELNNY